jgi:hypothetical protein
MIIFGVRLVLGAALATAAKLPSPCVLIVAGTGTDSAKPEVASFWHEVTIQTARELSQQMGSGLMAPVEIIPLGTADSIATGRIASALASTKCDWLLEMVHRLGADGSGNYFGWSVKIFRAMPFTEGPDARAGFRIQNLAFEKLYRYPLTEASLKALSMREIATRMKEDVRTSKVFSP